MEENGVKAVSVKVSGVDEAAEKLEQLGEKLKSAKSLADDLAQSLAKLSIKL